MTDPVNDDEIGPIADRLYAGRAALLETERKPRPLGVAELVQFLSDPQRSLTMDEQRYLFSDPRLLAAYRRLKARLRVVELPALVAASSGDVSSRTFNGGTLRIHPSRVAGQMYVVLRSSWPTGAPRTLLLESSDGELVKRPLPAPDGNGEMMLVLDLNSVNDEAFFRLISDPTTTGSFVM